MTGGGFIRGIQESDTKGGGGGGKNQLFFLFALLLPLKQSGKNVTNFLCLSTTGSEEEGEGQREVDKVMPKPEKKA